MSPELINAIKERIISGQDKSVIRTEVLAMGHSEEIFEAAYTLAQHDVSKTPENAAAVPLGKVSLTSIHVLVRQAWRYAKNRLLLVSLLAVPLVLMAILTELARHFEDNLSISGAISGVTLVVAIFYILHMLSALYLVSREQELTQVTYREAISWTRKNILGILFVYLLMILVVMGGFMFFIIPGFILLVSLYFCQYVYIVEGRKGVSALHRSSAVVKGRKIAVIKKVLGLVLYFMVPVFLVSFCVELIRQFYAIDRFAVVGEIILQIATAFFSIISMHVMLHLYHELASSTPDTADEKKSSFLYVALAIWGGLCIVALIVLAVLYQGVSKLEESVLLSSTDNVRLMFEMNHLSEKAVTYRTEAGSFEGVCETILPLSEATGAVECNDDSEMWAVSVTEGESTLCVDSDRGVAKRVPSGLEGKTSCIRPL